MKVETRMQEYRVVSKLVTTATTNHLCMHHLVVGDDGDWWRRCDLVILNKMIKMAYTI